MGRLELARQQQQQAQTLSLPLHAAALRALQRKRVHQTHSPPHFPAQFATIPPSAPPATLLALAAAAAVHRLPACGGWGSRLLLLHHHRTLQLSPPAATPQLAAAAAARRQQVLAAAVRPVGTAAAGAMARAPHPRGAFIVFEGLDRCGKTTQCAKLLEHLHSMKVGREGACVRACRAAVVCPFRTSGQPAHRTHGRRCPRSCGASRTATRRPASASTST